MRDFKGRVAVITGGASGIGQALAQALAKQGCDLALVDINAEQLKTTADALGSRRVSTHVVDVSQRDQMQRLVDDVVDVHGRVDIVVNNAGVSVAGTFEEQTLEDFEWIVGINLWGVVYGCKFFLPHLKNSDSAYIVNLSSMFGLIGVPGQSSYCATKFAVRGFSEAIGVELARTNINVMSVHPGGIGTNIAKSTRWIGAHRAQKQSTMKFFERHTMSAQRAADIVVRGMIRGQTRVLIAREAYVADVVKRLFPALPRELLARGHEWFLNRV